MLIANLRNSSISGHSNAHNHTNSITQPLRKVIVQQTHLFFVQLGLKWLFGFQFGCRLLFRYFFFVFLLFLLIFVFPTFLRKRTNSLLPETSRQQYRNRKLLSTCSLSFILLWFKGTKWRIFGCLEFQKRMQTIYLDVLFIVFAIPFVRILFFRDKSCCNLFHIQRFWKKIWFSSDLLGLLVSGTHPNRLPYFRDICELAILKIHGNKSEISLVAILHSFGLKSKWDGMIEESWPMNPIGCQFVLNFDWLRNY